MATGTLTSMILTAGASMLANGSDATLGGKPIASNSGAPLDITDSVNGETGAPTLKVMNDSTLEIQAIQSVLYTVTAEISANLSNVQINEFNSMTSGLGDAVFSAPFDLYSGNAYTVMTTSDSIDSVLTYGRTESASVLGGSATATEIEGDARKLGTTFGSAIAFVETSNQFINAANNSSELFTGGTFPGMDSVISGSVTGVSLASQPLGADLTALGDVISWADITNLGSPGQLLSNMLDNGTLGPMYAKLATVTVNPRIAVVLGADTSTIANISGNVTLGSLGLDLNTVAAIGANLPRSVQQQIYNLFVSLSASELAQVKGILKCTQTYIATGADLFDPTK